VGAIFLIENLTVIGELVALLQIKIALVVLGGQNGLPSAEAFDFHFEEF
jgi:hypothetical protein